MSLSEVIRSLFGVWRLFLIDKRGIEFFDNTRNRTINSFIIPALVYTILLIVLAQDSENYQGTIPLSWAIFVQTIGFIISLCGYLLVTYFLVDYLDKKQEFMHYVQVNNWMALIALGLTLPIILIGNVENPMIQFLFLMLLIFRKIYDWFIVQTVFKIQWYWIILVLLGGEAVDAMSSLIAYTTIY